MISILRYDKQLQQIDGTLSTIEMQREALEGANTNTAVLNTMNDAAKALKKANADLDVDKVSSHPIITKRPYNVNSVYFGLSDDVNDEFRLLFVFG